MSKLILSLILGSLLFSACRKETFQPVFEEAKTNCLPQTDNPFGRSYGSDSIAAYSCPTTHCGILPLNSNSYWVFEDSFFVDGGFSRVQLDTLRYAIQMRSEEDGLVWWKGNLNIGLPDIIYTNDSSFYSLNDRMYNPQVKDVKKEYGLFAGDSIKYLTSFDDVAAIGRSLKLAEPVVSPAGTFHGCVYFEKNARNYRRDQIWFRPGVGVIRYIREKAPMGLRVIKLQQVSTLVAFQIN